jgi:replicative DNA helicase
VRSSAARPAATLLARLHPGDLALLGSRPGQGKTLLALDVAIHAMRSGHRAAFFTLDFTRADVADCFRRIGEDLDAFTDSLLIDGSDRICADYIIDKLQSASPGTVVVVDYLQLLDQRREHADLMQQVRRLREFARERGLIVLCLSQIVRSFDPAKRPLPDIGDVRLPNPLDMRLFDTTCLLHQGRMRMASSA